MNADAIRMVLLQEIEGIMDAKVFENDTDFGDVHGLPPHSTEAIVYGGFDGDMVRVIYAHLSAGIQIHRTLNVPVITASGGTKNVRFSRP